MHPFKRVALAAVLVAGLAGCEAPPTGGTRAGAGSGGMTPPAAGQTTRPQRSHGSEAAPAAQPVSGLQGPAPAGWSTSLRGGHTVYTSGRTPSGGINQLEVLPAQAASSDWRNLFLGIWTQQLRPRYATSFTPLPLRMRLSSGLVLLFDFASSQIALGGRDWVTPGLYVLTDGHVAVPMVATLRDFNEVERQMRDWLPQLRLGGGQRAPALYLQTEVTGTWRSSSNSMASYVDASGHYLGDASMASGETLTIQPGGRCNSAFAAVGGGLGRMRVHNSGQCSVHDDSLSVPSERGPRSYRITGLGQSPDGHRFMILGITREDYPSLIASSQQPRAGDLYVGQ